MSSMDVQGYRVHAETKTDGSVFVKIHRLDADGKEHVPLAYILGYNAANMLYAPTSPAEEQQ